MTKKKWISLILYFMIMAVLIIFDQYTKSLSILHLKNQLPYPLVKQVLELHYLENHGAAFGMLQNRIWFFVIMAAVIVLFILLLLIKMPWQYDRPHPARLCSRFYLFCTHQFSDF